MIHNFSFKKISIIFVSILMLAILVITLTLLKKQQDNRSRASSTTPTVTFVVDQTTVNPQEPFRTDLILDTKGQNIVAVNFKLTYDPNILEFLDFDSDNVFNKQLTPNASSKKGVFQYVGLDTTGAIHKGLVPLGKISFKGNRQGISTIQISSVEIANESGIVPVENSALTTLTVSDTANVTTTPTASNPNPINAPNPTSRSPLPTSIITPLPTVANTSGQAMLTIRVIVPGIGSNTQKGENQKPIRTSRTAKLQIYNAQKALVKKLDTTLAYNPSESVYKNTVSLGNIPEGQYLIKINVDNTVPRDFPSTIPLSINNTSTTTALILRPGNINGDNELNMLDYTQLIGCIKNTTCSAGVKADFNEDGKVNIYDYNIMIRSLR